MADLSSKKKRVELKSNKRKTPVIVIGGRFVIKRLLSHEKDNIVFGAYDLRTATNVALKAERKTVFKKRDFSPLSVELNIMRRLQTMLQYDGGPQFFPQLLWQGQEPEYNMASIELMGPDLLELCKKYQGFCDYTILRLGAQMLHRLEQLHKRGYLHRDIKPNNFVIGSHGNRHKVYLIDFGLAVAFPQTSVEWGNVNNDKIGNICFTSFRWHNCDLQNVWDDLEGLAYSLFYFKNGGTLPWIKTERKKRTLEALIIDKVEFTQSHDKSLKAISNFFMATRQRTVCIPDYKYWIEQFRIEALLCPQRQDFEWL